MLLCNVGGTILSIALVFGFQADLVNGYLVNGDMRIAFEMIKKIDKVYN